MGSHGPNMVHFKSDVISAPNLTLKCVFKFLEIFDRNDIRFEVDHVWTMRGRSFANLKEERGTKERPPGPEGDHRPPPPPSPVISKDPFQVIEEGYSVSQFGYLLTCILDLSTLLFINLLSKLGLVSIAQPQAKKS